MYKRQVYGNQDVSKTIDGDYSTNYSSASLGSPEANRGHSIIIEYTLEPVSYTHLDVYKRQTLNTVIKVEQDFGFVKKGLKANIWVNFKNWSSSSYNRSITPYLFRAVGYLSLIHI